MKIATWNLERPTKSTKRNQKIIDCLKKIDADILILTETNEVIKWSDDYNHFYSKNLPETYYKTGEKRVSIYSKFPPGEQHETFRNDTSICINFHTPLGELAIYATVIGINGNRRKDFIADLDQQSIDFKKIANSNNLCICGDLNMSFSDNYYFTKEGREKLNNVFNTLNLLNLTANIAENIDHIVLPKKITGTKNTKLETWNTDKKLSDHIGVSVELI
jgi:endonuclease/exonuclease/phosphatase family metal-dependent hydrolase